MSRLKFKTTFLVFLILASQIFVITGRADKLTQTRVPSKSSDTLPIIQEDRPIDQQQISVIGEVRNIVCRSESDFMYSYVTFFVSEIMVGSETLRRTEITIKHLGGYNDSVVQWQSDQPYFYVGEVAEVYLSQEDNFFIVVEGRQGKTNLKSPSIEAETVAGYKLLWYKPGVGWSTASSRPGSDWYGPLRWDEVEIPVDYWIDTRNIPSGVSESSFVNYTILSYQTWENDLGSTLDYTYQGIRTDVEPGDNDGINVCAWRNIDGSGGTVGVANIWGSYTIGDYDSFRMVDADLTLDTSESWSAAPSSPFDRFDVQNVATHEAGHISGLADLYDPEDSELTMYGYTSMGETKSRTLEWGDQAGIRSLYPSINHSVTFYTNPDDIGSITFDGFPYTTGQLESYDSGDYLATANAPPDYAFHHWEYGDGVYVPNTGANPVNVTVSGDGWLKAVFSAKVTFYTDPTSVGGIRWGSDLNPLSTNGDYIYDVNLLPDYSNDIVAYAGPVTSYTFSHWEVTGGVNIDTNSSTPTTGELTEPGTIKAVYTRTSAYTLTDFPEPYVTPTGILNSTLVIGEAHPHGPFGWGAHSVDVYSSLYTTYALGNTSEGNLTAVIDTWIAEYNSTSGEVTVFDTSSNLITVAGYSVNLMTYYYATDFSWAFSVDGREPIAPVHYYRPWHEDPLQQRTWINIEGQTLTYSDWDIVSGDSDYVLLELVPDGENGRYVLIVSGFTGQGTEAGCKVLAAKLLGQALNFEFGGMAMLLKWVDTNDDERVQLTEVSLVTSYP